MKRSRTARENHLRVDGEHVELFERLGDQTAVLHAALELDDAFARKVEHELVALELLVLWQVLGKLLQSALRLLVLAIELFEEQDNFRRFIFTLRLCVCVFTFCERFVK